MSRKHAPRTDQQHASKPHLQYIDFLAQLEACRGFSSIPSHLLGMTSDLLLSILVRLSWTCHMNPIGLDNWRIDSHAVLNDAQMPTPLVSHPTRYTKYLKKFLKESGLSLTAFILSLYFLYQYWQIKVRTLEDLLLANKHGQATALRPPTSSSRLKLYSHSRRSQVTHCAEPFSTQDHTFSPLASFRLFVAAATLSDKYLHDESYSSVFWRKVCNLTFNSHASTTGYSSQKAYSLMPSGFYFTLAELNESERALLQDLDYSLFVEVEAFQDFLIYLQTRLLLEEFRCLRTDKLHMSYREMSIFYTATEAAANLNTNPWTVTSPDATLSTPYHGSRLRPRKASSLLVHYTNPTAILYVLYTRVLYCFLVYIITILLMSLLIRTAITVSFLSLAQFLNHQEFQLNAVLRSMDDFLSPVQHVL